MKLPIATLGAALLGGMAALGIAVLPGAALESLVMGSGLPAVFAAAEPPLGLTARAGLALGLGGFAALVSWLALFVMLGLQTISLGRRGAGPADADEVAAPVVRRADAHPDAPPRPPLLATRDLGDPFFEAQPARAPAVASLDKVDTDAASTVSVDSVDTRAASSASVDSVDTNRAAPADRSVDSVDTNRAAPANRSVDSVDPDRAAPADRSVDKVDTDRGFSALALGAVDALDIAGRPLGAPVPKPVDAPRPIGSVPKFAVEKDPAPAARVTPPAPPVEQALPRDLEQPLAAFDPAAMLPVPMPPAEPVTPLHRVPAPSAQAPRERFEIFALTPPARTAPTPQPSPAVPPLPPRAARGDAIARPETEASVHALLDRLERGVVRTRLPESPKISPARREAERGLEEALVTLRNLARRA